MTEDEAFIARIVADPRDDVPRVVYADYLDESGRPERAEFIRTQIRLTELRSEVLALATYRDAQVDLSLLSMWEGEPITPERRARCEEALALIRRERELLGGVLGFGTKALPGIGSLIRSNRGSPAEYAWFPQGSTGTICAIAATFRRGFVAEIACYWPACRDHLDAIRKEQPIEKVVLTTLPEVGSPTMEYRSDGDCPVRLTIAGEWVEVPMALAVLTRDSAPKLLSLRWPGIAFELPAADREEGFERIGMVGDLFPEPTRDRIEAAVRREMPVGERVVWVSAPSNDYGGLDWMRADHICPADNAAPFPLIAPAPPPEEYPTRVFRRVELTLANFLGPRQTRAYRGRCSLCRTTFLAEFHPPVPEVPNGRQR